MNVAERKYIKSPINYTGNKYRLLPQFEQYLPKHEVNLFVDLFCGGVTVGINANAKKIVMVDNNPRVISLLKYLAECKIESFITNVEGLISFYGLTYTAKYGYDFYKKNNKDNNGLKEFNKEGFYRLREDYNSLKNKDSAKANTMLYTLMVYGFNNDLRFNKDGNYNLPVGKTDLNKNNIKKIKEYNAIAKSKNILFVCNEYNSPEVLEYVYAADFVYLDPPYLITNAVYNEGNNWIDKDEKELVNLLSELDRNNVKFALSNVITKSEVENKILKGWLDDHKTARIMPLEYNYRSCSYNKKDRNANEQEVLILNY